MKLSFRVLMTMQRIISLTSRSNKIGWYSLCTSDYDQFLLKTKKTIKYRSNKITRHIIELESSVTNTYHHQFHKLFKSLLMGIHVVQQIILVLCFLFFFENRFYAFLFISCSAVFLALYLESIVEITYRRFIIAKTKI